MNKESSPTPTINVTVTDSSILAPTPNSISEFLTKVTSSDQTPTKALTNEITPTMPAYAQPHPALTSVKSLLGYDYPCCDSKMWQVIDATEGELAIGANTPIPHHFQSFVSRRMLTATQTLQAFDVNFKDNSIIIKMSPKTSVTLSLKDDEGKVIDVWGSELKQFFQIDDTFAYFSVQENYLLLHGYCYGDISISGLHIIDSQRSKFYTISETYAGNCEGGIPFNVAPDGKKLVYGTYVLTLDNIEMTKVCTDDEFTRSHAWSQNGRFLYLACGQAGLPDQLYRYDTLTREETILTDRNHIPFKAVKLYPSPDQNRIIFLWQDSNFALSEKYGAWLLDLTWSDE